MREFKVNNYAVTESGPCYVIAEIGHNHQGDLKTALKMVKMSAGMGVNAVKLQKRNNQQLFTRSMYNKPYDNENSYGSTYGEHREFLEFGLEEYRELKKCADDNDVDFFATAFDFKSVDFLADLGLPAFKFASGDITNIPLLEYAAKIGKPMFVSTGAASFDDVKRAYEAILKYNDKLCIFHCVAGYPAEYETLNLRAITTLKNAFPEAAIGYSGHDYGILAPVVAYMLGAVVVEKHFTLNRAWKGTDHKFSLEPTGLYKMIRDLRRVDCSMGDGRKVVQSFEIDARNKMGKSLYSSRPLAQGTIISAEDIVLKSPGGGLFPYQIEEIVGKRVKADMPEEALFVLANLE